MEIRGDLDRQLGDAAKVHAGVGVVVLDDLPEHARGAAVGVTELEQRREPVVALVREDRE